ncbi:hypothetical protein [Pseudomonas sp. CCC3.1]|uniref:hypothetical protein n=1 Tax=Pseudomonas sp. CCC3.1 TaxID=3048607 RepID=UPI002AC9382F|nr:hypothetical protein [Pseudomonas sp. CCC3.1]MEB0207891.1 hypothetical protein [Pseudomonas sp. CCC3.1]WPX35507.1 hypothetical protein RHM56_19795 [Pseudomonas sp. CCC3.1]
MTTKDTKIVEVWRQATIPVVFKREKSPLLIKLPFAKDNFDWLRNSSRNKPEWSAQYKSWQVPAAWFEDSVKRLLGRFKKVYVIQLYREYQVCAPACWNAHGLHCECSCMGANHGTGQPAGKWYEVSETFAAQWGPKKYACRLMVSTV